MGFLAAIIVAFFCAVAGLLVIGPDVPVEMRAVVVLDIFFWVFGVIVFCVWVCGLVHDSTLRMYYHLKYHRKKIIPHSSIVLWKLELERDIRQQVIKR